MPDKTWKKFERTVASYFGVRRTGPMQEKDANDIDHPVIHCQCKHSKRHAIATVWDAAKKVADKSNKIPVVAIKQKGRHGFWLLIHESSLLEVAKERTEAVKEIRDSLSNDRP